MALERCLRSPRPEHGGGEANLVLPDLNSATFFGGVGGRTLLMVGLIVCALGLGFGLMMYSRLKNMPVHKSMLEVSELIYSTCKTYLETQGKFLLILEIFIGAIILFYYGVLLQFDGLKVAIILLFSLVGIAGSYGVACVRHPRQHVRQLADVIRRAARTSRSPATTFRCRPA